MAIRFNKHININSIVKKLVYTILALIVGGAIMTTFGTVVTGTSSLQCSPFFSGLGLIGWTVNSSNCVTATSSAGILSVVGIIGIASVVMEFIRF